MNESFCPTSKTITKLIGVHVPKFVGLVKELVHGLKVEMK